MNAVINVTRPPGTIVWSEARERMFDFKWTAAEKKIALAAYDEALDAAIT